MLGKVDPGHRLDMPAPAGLSKVSTVTKRCSGKVPDGHGHMMAVAREKQVAGSKRHRVLDELADGKIGSVGVNVDVKTIGGCHGCSP